MLSKHVFKRPSNTLESEGSAIHPAVPEELYLKCKSCEGTFPREDFERALKVCPYCGQLSRLSARERIALLCDEGSFEELFEEIVSGDPLDFPGYVQKLDKAGEISGENEGIVCGTGAVDGIRTAVYAMEPGFMLGSMGVAVGEKLTRLFEMAAEESLPVTGFTVSGGARMQEGILSLMQMAKTSGAVKLHSDAGGLYIAVLTDPTTGGVTASFAMEADIILAEPGALIGFAGPRVIEQTTHQTLPEGFHRAEFLLEKGFIDAIVERRELRERILLLLQLHGRDA
jgi:acetyl-CoA carboxylase carboxyl transferase subunit beta